MPAKIDLINKKFGKWFVLQKVDSRGNSSYYLCRCDCGKEKSIRGTHLTMGKSRSCGCLITELSNPKLASARKVYSNGYNDGNLSFAEFLSLSSMPCFYCAKEISNSVNRYAWKTSGVSQFAIDNGKFIYNGLDRIDSKLPHNKNNVVSCCSDCNYAKSDMSLEKFRDWISRVYNNFILKNK